MEARTGTKEPFCLNSKRWLHFMFWPPGKCPYTEIFNGNACLGCGYLEYKETTKYYKKKMEAFND